MTAGAWGLVKSVLGRALEVSAAKRSQWLREQRLRSSVAQQVRGLLQEEPLWETAAAEAPAPAAPRFATGDEIAGRFLILEFIARGGMGEVYAALDREVGDRVALKTVPAGLGDREQYVAQLRREIRLARKIDSPHVCRMFDVHRLALGEGELLCVSMQLLDGRSLQQHIESGRLSETRTLEIAAQVATGLDAIHAAGIVHRDLKSGNVMLSGPEPRAVIVDFGLSREAAVVADSIFATGAIVGTPAFMAPEQLEGRAATAAADVYAFGVLLYHCLTGRLPFEGGTPLAVALRKMQGPAPNVREVEPSVSPHLAAAIDACLQIQPELRPGSAGEVVAIARGEAVSAARVRRFRRRVVLAGLCTIVGTGAGVLAWKSAPHRAPEEAVIHWKRGEELARRRTADGIQSAIAEYRQAIRIDEQYAAAWAGLADAYAAAAHFVLMDAAEARKQAGEAAGRALALDGSQPKAYAALAYVRATDLQRWREADALFRRAVDAFPNEALLHAWYAAYLGRARRHAEAVGHARICARLDPGSFSMNHQLAIEYFRAGMMPEYLAQTEELVRLHPLEVSSRLARARALELHGRFAEAEEEIRVARVYGAGDVWRSYLGTLRVAQGRRAEAQAIAKELHAAWLKKPVETNLVVTVYGALGMGGEAASILEAALERGDSTVLAAPANPYMRLVAEDPRVQAVFRRLGFS